MNCKQICPINPSEKLGLARPIHVFALICLSLSFHSFAQEGGDRQEQADAWLRIYPKHVQGIYVHSEDYQHDAPIRLKSVVVALSDESEWPDYVPKTSLVNFVSGETESGQGCMFTVDKEGIDTRPPWKPDSDVKAAGIDQDICGRFRLSFVKRLQQQAKACAQYDDYRYKKGWTLRTHPVSSQRLFVSRDLKQVRCLSQLVLVWVDTQDQAGKTRRNEIDIEGDDRVRAYLHLESNQVVHCDNYGKPTVYRSELLPEAEAVRVNHHPDYLSAPTWQKQYFIKTSGFKSSCWGSLRMIDEPISAYSSLYLNDGTLLLKGETSVLRIRASDGSTEASHELVKIFDPAFVQGVLKNSYKGSECEADSLVGGNCTLAVDDGWQLGSVNQDKYWKPYIKHVIQGVDAVMQQIFTNAK